jgi:tRNA(Ile)-lysidine synthase
MRGARPGAALEAAFAASVAPAAGETIVAAVSGGKDSVALAALLVRTAARSGATAVLAHVNHGLRRTAWQDEAVVLALGAALRVRVVTASLPEGSSAEERLRDERYAALASLAERAGARRVVSAHHARDQAETVLLALLRGTGPDGLVGMPVRRPLAGDIALERPLLDVEPDALAAYVAAEALPYAPDPSNADVGYRRNALRAALADLRVSFPHLDAAVARCAAIVRDERDGTSRAAIRADVRVALEISGAGTRDVSFERLDAIARSIERGSGGRHFVRRGVEVIVKRGGAVVR